MLLSGFQTTVNNLEKNGNQNNDDQGDARIIHETPHVIELQCAQRALSTGSSST